MTKLGRATHTSTTCVALCQSAHAAGSCQASGCPICVVSRVCGAKPQPYSALQVRKLANRKNTVNGRIYKNDPTIMSLELCNECQ